MLVYTCSVFKYLVIEVNHRHRRSVNFEGDIFAPKCMYEKLIKCAAETGFEIQSYIPRTHEIKNRILSKNKGCLFFLLPKYINCLNIT